MARDELDKEPADLPDLPAQVLFACAGRNGLPRRHGPINVDARNACFPPPADCELVVCQATLVGLRVARTEPG